MNNINANKFLFIQFILTLIFAIVCMFGGAVIYKTVLDTKAVQKEERVVEIPVIESTEDLDVGSVESYLSDIAYYLASIDKNIESMMWADSHDIGYIKGQLDGISDILKKK